MSLELEAREAGDSPAVGCEEEAAIFFLFLTLKVSLSVQAEAAILPPGCERGSS